MTNIQLCCRTYPQNSYDSSLVYVHVASAHGYIEANLPAKAMHGLCAL